VRIKVDRLVIVHHCFLILAKISLGNAAIAIGSGILWIKIDRLVIVGDRLFILA